VEFADLHGLKKADIDQVKAQLSRAADRARLAYGKLPVERPRQWIPWGTANNDTYLRDQTGNRRFWPAKINHCDIPKLKADLQQLWGEAATREAAGESIRLPPALYGAATVEQEKRLDTKADPYTDALAHALGDIEGKITGENVWQILGITIAGNRTQHHNERMGAAMRYLGWKRKQIKIGGRARPGYVKGAQPLREVFVHGERGDVRVSHDKDDGVEFDGE
jgi:predicted P-loop ATPase